MDYNQLEIEFSRILSLPLWQRPIEVALLEKRLKIPAPDIRKSFDHFWTQVRLEDMETKRGKS